MRIVSNDATASLAVQTFNIERGNMNAHPNNFNRTDVIG